MKYLMASLVMALSTTAFAETAKKNVTDRCQGPLKRSYGNYHDKSISGEGYVHAAQQPLLHPFNGAFFATYNTDVYVYSGVIQGHNSWEQELVVVDPKGCKIIETFFVAGD